MYDSLIKPTNRSASEALAIQCKLTVGEVDDPLELEADAMANKVMRMPEPQFVQRKCAHCEEEEKKLQRKPANSFIQSKGKKDGVSADYVLQGQIEQRTGREMNLPDETKDFMEARFGTDFSKVRLHTDAGANRLSDDLNAQAFTVGTDIYFNSGKFAPQSDAGKYLLAHELSHVVQQSGHGEAQVQRKPAHTLRARSGYARRPPIVEDGHPVLAGQMNKTRFLSALYDQLMRVCGEELARGGRSASDCPYIVRSIEYYRHRPVTELMRLIHHFAHPPAGADVEGLIHAVVAKARAAAHKLAQQGERRPQAMSAYDNEKVASYDPAAMQQQLGGGNSFNGPVRDQMEHSFGTSFHDVHVHTSATAAHLNDEMGSRAFTVGSHIAFASGQYRPGTLAGDALIAHELAHTLQQNEKSASTDARSYKDLEQQADHASMAALSGSNGIAALQSANQGLRIQRDGVGEVALIIALTTAEVGGEVAVEEGVIVVATDVAAPAIIDATAPAAVDLIVPTAVDTLAPAAVDTTTAAVSSTSSIGSTLTIGAIGVGAATTLSGDSSTEEDDRRRSCLEQHPTALICDEEISMEEQVQEFILRQGYDFGSLGDCSGVSSFAANVITECNGAPGESWHCNVEPYFNPVTRQRLPGGTVSIFSCLCCREDGTTGFEWRGAHWSPGPG